MTTLKRKTGVGYIVNQILSQTESCTNMHHIILQDRYNNIFIVGKFADSWFLEPVDRFIEIFDKISRPKDEIVADLKDNKLYKGPVDAWYVKENTRLLNYQTYTDPNITDNGPIAAGNACKGTTAGVEEEFPMRGKLGESPPTTSKLDPSGKPGRFIDPTITTTTTTECKPLNTTSTLSKHFKPITTIPKSVTDPPKREYPSRKLLSTGSSILSQKKKTHDDFLASIFKSNIPTSSKLVPRRLHQQQQQASVISTLFHKPLKTDKKMAFINKFIAAAKPARVLSSANKMRTSCGPPCTKIKEKFEQEDEDFF